ncbi:MAG: hypothetical protein ABJO01_00875 [Parasphingorhabdus sp.]|uniref:hypothetical protein n=1 Tax=Parasphingorhabdus sp. TaxID=2709688 RepID=UPI003296B6F6
MEASFIKKLIVLFGISFGLTASSGPPPVVSIVDESHKHHGSYVVDGWRVSCYSNEETGYYCITRPGSTEISIYDPVIEVSSGEIKTMVFTSVPADRKNCKESKIVRTVELEFSALSSRTIELLSESLIACTQAQLTSNRMANLPQLLDLLLRATGER